MPRLHKDGALLGIAIVLNKLIYNVHPLVLTLTVEVFLHSRLEGPIELFYHFRLLMRVCREVPDTMLI